MKPPRILMPSIAGPNDLSGAGTVTRQLMRMLEAQALSASTECLTAGLPARRSLHRWRQATAVARSLAGQMPARAAFTYSDELRETVRTRSRDCDAAIVNGAEMLWLLPELPPDLPRVLVAHNIEHEVFALEAEIERRRFPPIAGLLRREVEHMREWETSRMKAVGRAIFLSRSDARRALECGWVADACVIPPVFFDARSARRPRQEGLKLHAGFLGNLYWWPNVKGLGWFLNHVLPQVRDRVQLHIFGPGSGRYGRHAGVVGHGRIADVARVWETCDLMISPLLHGGGVSVKVAEALYQSMPLLATRCSMRGFETPADPCIAIADTAEEWVEVLRGRAQGWRGQSVSPSISALFAAQPHTQKLQNFVTGAKGMGYA